MTLPSSRPHMFGGHVEPMLLPWHWATERLTTSRHYWIATTRDDGRPHSRPVWGVWSADQLYFSTGSLAVQHLTHRPDITAHLESGSEVVIIEGIAKQVTERAILEQVILIYNAKYHGGMDVDHLPGPFYAVRPRIVFGWISDETGLDGGRLFMEPQLAGALIPSH
jgi:hypothetical protein